MANGEFGYCEDCQYWDPGAEGETRPCSRINDRQEVDVEMEDGGQPADQQRFKTRARYGCVLFEPVEGMEGQPAGDTDTDIDTETQTEISPEAGPENLDEFLNY